MTIGLTIRAILWPTETVVHAVAVPDDVKGYFANSETARLCLNDKELSSLMQFISNSFSKDSLGKVEVLSKRLEEHWHGTITRDQIDGRKCHELS